MKKYVLGIILAALVLVPFAAMAETGGSADAVVTISSVINTVVVDNWASIALTQALIGTYAGGGGGLMPWTGTADVTVQAITAWKVYGCYSATHSTLGEGAGIFSPTPNEDSVLKLTSITVAYPFDAYLPYRHFGVPGAHGLSEATASGETDLVPLGFAGTNNIASPNQAQYNLAWDPSKLSGSMSVGESIDFTVFFIVTDTDT